VPDNKEKAVSKVSWRLLAVDNFIVMLFVADTIVRAKSGEAL
jgi:hypothetical protein